VSDQDVWVRRQTKVVVRHVQLNKFVRSA
jgi:hypothetical protein